MNGFIISLYIAFALYNVFPFKEQVFAIGGTDAMRTILAIVLYAILVGISIYLLRLNGLGKMGKIGLPKIILGVLAVGFILALGYQIFALPHLIVLPPIFEQLFGPSQYFFWWFVAPFVGVFFLG